MLLGSCQYSDKYWLVIFFESSGNIGDYFTWNKLTPNFIKSTASNPNGTNGLITMTSSNADCLVFHVDNTGLDTAGTSEVQSVTWIDMYGAIGKIRCGTVGDITNYTVEAIFVGVTYKKAGVFTRTH